MARQGLPSAGENLGEIGDDVDSLFDDLENKNKCELEEIDPSRPDWEIYLHFEKDPQVEGAEGYEDFNTLKGFAKLGIAKCIYRPSNKTVTISYLEGCSEEEFPEEYLELMRKYNPRAKAPKESRRTLLPPTESAIKLTHDSTAEIMVRAGLMADNPPVIFEAIEIPDDILITIPLKKQKLAEILQKTGCKDLKELVQKIFDLSDNENLEYEGGENDEDQTFVINLFKAGGQEYKDLMSAQNLAFLEMVPNEKIYKDK